MQHPRRCAFAGVVAVLLLRGGSAGAQTLAAGFRDDVVFRNLVRPTAVQFASDGRVFVAEKRGVVLVFRDLADDAPAVFADMQAAVDDDGERGLLGLALHPDFPRTPYVYVLYTLRVAPGSPDARSAGVSACEDAPGDGCVVGARLSRLRAVGDAAARPEEVLLEAWCQQYRSHSVGGLAFGDDGALYVSAGDGASARALDWGQHGRNVCGDQPDAGGALRAQSVRAAGVSLDGAVLRLDAATGAAQADNPRPGSRVIAYGLRDPVRIAVRPGTRELWIADAGWRSWEEIDRISDTADATVENFGWPCFEGPEPEPGYAAARLGLCEQLYASPAATTPPFFAYRHDASVVAGDACASGPGGAVSALAFYRGGRYPPSLEGALFFADAARSCIWAMPAGPDGTPDPSRRFTLEAGAGAPVDIEPGPDGDLFYVDTTAGRLHRIRPLVPRQSARTDFHA